MRVVLDTNILVSALLVQSSIPGKIHAAWLDGNFTLLISAEQIVELRSTLSKPKIAARLRPHEAGRLVNNSADWRRRSIDCRMWSVRPIRRMIFCLQWLKLALPTIL